MATKKGGLGRGLESLFNENATETEKAVNVRLNDIEPNRNQPRKDFDEEALAELSESIAKHGLIQPIVVRPTSNGTYTIIAGERRWRACRMAGLESVPVIVKDVDERTVMEVALIENLQREDLNAVEEALGYKALIDTYKLTQEEVAKSVGKSRTAVTNTIRLLELKEVELNALREGNITAGHARALLSIDVEDIRIKAFNMALAGCSVRDIENLSKQAKAPKTGKTDKKTTYHKEVELALAETLGRKVQIKAKGKKGGTITLEFFDDNELKELVKKISE